MASVLRASAADHSPSTPLNITRIYDRDDDVASMARLGCRRTHIDNARKSKHHCRIVRDAEKGELIGFIDVDAMVLGDLSEVQSMDFDIAYTVRTPECKWRLNTGVYFVRITERVQKFVSSWYAMSLRMLSDKRLHEEWKRNKRYGGLHQAAFGWMIENSSEDLKLLALPCESWNVLPNVIEESYDVRVVHVMSSFREWCFGRNRAKTDKQRALVERWQEYNRCVSG